ncbi:MAG: DUF4402 domain-containing protein [Rhodospirillales bacterium]|nr:DUF4402 domain-containing protein [Alphaproteobacteria bacterium]USO03056.1 MAG: DUF4402 domain-containing protein [Rhodospirillales bacterium]
MKQKKHIKNKLIKIAALSVALCPLPVKGQSINCIQPMVFGDIVPCGTAGTVTVNPDGSSATGGCVTVGGAPQANARCVVTQGFPFRPIQVSVTSPTFTMNNGGAGVMNVNGFNLITNGGGYTKTVTAPFVNVPIGATANVGANQAAGTYSGSFIFSAVLQ